MTVPNGGEVWQPGLPYFIQWGDDIAENVVIELFKGGALAQTIATNAPSTGAYKWNLDANLLPGSDYSIKVRSATNSALADLSDSPFSIVAAPALSPGLSTRLSDGRMQLGLTAPGAVQATVLGSTNLSIWEDLQTVPLTNGNAVFIDNNTTNFARRFYRLRLP